ncbi:Aminotransferase class-III [Purpureocillium lavendulum]|uniref:Aminotransferase class-III n=1 Tax=Purpureocillium lavendulum TaxID=1247861 RepID=A0AB34FID8_9HYPO|nr:Aminotransferase class-III [Purpureocillium lavendulum]
MIARMRHGAESLGRSPTWRYGQRRCASSVRPRAATARHSSAAASNPPTSASPQGKDWAGVRTAEAREAALRAARMMRVSEKEERDNEDAQRRREHEEYRKRYKTAARKWVSSIIALPIMLVTSYYLFDRRECTSRSRPTQYWR